MNKKCFICQSNIKTNLIIEYNKSTHKYINNNYINDNFMVFFRNKNMYTCMKCSKHYLSFINLKNKTKNILNSKIIGSYNINNNNCFYKFTDNFDYCFLCNKKTKYKIDTNINDRYNYIKGIGQLCSNCII